MHINIKDDIVKLFCGFSAVGLVTTLLSLALINIFLKLMHMPLITAYIGIYLITLALSFVMNSIFVFKSSLSYKNGIKYLAIYLSGLFLGTLLLWILKETIPLENYILAYLVLPFTMTWNFALSYILLKQKRLC